MREESESFRMGFPLRWAQPHGEDVTLQLSRNNFSFRLPPPPIVWLSPPWTSCLLHFLVPVYSGRPPFSPNSFSIFFFFLNQADEFYIENPKSTPPKKFNENGTVRNHIRQSSQLTTMSPTGRKSHPWLSLATCYLLMASTAIFVAAQHEPDRPLDQEQVTQKSIPELHPPSAFI